MPSQLANLNSVLMFSESPNCCLFVIACWLDNYARTVDEDAKEGFLGQRGDQRLSSQESEWTLAGRGIATTRTRGGGKGKLDIDKTIRNWFIPVWTPMDDEATEDEEKDEDYDNENEGEQVPLEVPTTAVAAVTPQHTRVILEVSQLNDLFDKFPCPTSSDTLVLKLRTVCIQQHGTCLQE